MPPDERAPASLESHPTTSRRLVAGGSSLTAAAIITITLIVINRANDTVAHRWADMSHVLEDAPLVLIENGVVHEDRMARMKVRLDDILENGRLDEGVERLADKARNVGAPRGDLDHREGRR